MPGHAMSVQLPPKLPWEVLPILFREQIPSSQACKTAQNRNHLPYKHLTKTAFSSFQQYENFKHATKNVAEVELKKECVPCG